MDPEITNITQFNQFFHQPTLHPLVGVGNLAQAEATIFNPTRFDMYCVVLMDEMFGSLTKDGIAVDYQAESLFCLSPGQVVETALLPNASPKGWILAFHPDLLKNSGLGRDFFMFNFFNYKTHRALNLNHDERRMIMNAFSTIITELHTATDQITEHMLRLGIGLLLSYYKRLSEKQLDDAEKQGHDLLKRLDLLLNNYLSSNLPQQKGQPSVAWCASQFNLSANYFGDIVKRELHITAKEFVQNKIIEASKSHLANEELPISTVAEMLGFTYSNHFARLFRQRTGQTPSEFRKTLKQS